MRRGLWCRARAARQRAHGAIAADDAGRGSIRWQRRAGRHCYRGALFEPSSTHGWQQLSQHLGERGCVDGALGSVAAVEALALSAVAACAPPASLSAAPADRSSSAELRRACARRAAGAPRRPRPPRRAARVGRGRRRLRRSSLPSVTTARARLEASRSRGRWAACALSQGVHTSADFGGVGLGAAVRVTLSLIVY